MQAFRVFSILLTVIGISLSILWLIRSTDAYPPLISIITFLIGVVGILGSTIHGKMNKLSIKGDGNSVLQDNSNKTTASNINQAKVEGNRNNLSQQ